MSHRQSPNQALRRILAPLLLVLAMSGCDAAAVLSSVGGTAADETLAVLAASVGAPEVVSGAEAGSSFDDAQAVALPPRSKLTINGQLNDIRDVRVFAFGPLQPGDVILAEVSAAPANLRAALFDDELSLVMANDDRNYYGGERDPRIQLTLRRGSEQAYLAITGSSVRGVSGLGAATVVPFQLTLTRGVSPAAPGPVPQTVWMEFGGGSGVRIAAEPLQDVPPFDPAAILPDLANEREYIIDRVVELMRADYEPFNVTLLRSDRDERPAGDHSTLYFGGYSGYYLGLADNVDYYNADPRQEAIVYTETLSLFAALRPSADRVAQAIANVGAHELGHLLGLEHAADPKCVMSEAASAQQVLNFDAVFNRSPLNPVVFSFGQQDCNLKLAVGVGPRDPAMGLDEFIAQMKQRGAARSRAADEPEPDVGPDIPLDALGLRACDHAE